MTTRIKGSWVVGYRDGDHYIIRDGEVVFRDDTILYVGKAYDGPVDDTIDATGHIVSPGFIDLDALVDYDHGILDVVVNRDEQGRMRLDPEKFRTTDSYSREDLQTKHRYSFIQLLMNGITTGMPIAGDAFRGWAETYQEMADSAAIAEEVGMRMYLGPSYRLYPSGSHQVEDPRGRPSFDDALRFIEDFDNKGGLVRAFLSPCQIMNMDEGMLKATKQASDQTGAPIRLHTGESLAELDYLREKYGKTPVEYLESIGFLGERTLLPHVLYTRPTIPGLGAGDEELAILARSGTTVVHCPIAESHGGSALYSLSRYLDAGVRMAFGTDTHPADMLQNLNFAWNLTRIVETGMILKPTGLPRHRWATDAQLYRMATLGGAAALGRQDLGRLAPGAQADIITVDISGPRSLPVEDPIRTLICNATGANVRNTVVAGRVVYRDGVFDHPDLPGLSRRFQQGFDRFKGLYTRFDTENRPGDVLFPPAFPME